MDLVQVQPIETLGQRGPRRQEMDRHFLRSGYRRKVYVCADPEGKWLRPPHRSRSPLTLVPIPVDEGAVVTLSYLDLEGQRCRLSLEAGRYYYLPPNVPYQLEAQGRGVLEIYAPATRPWELFPEERLPENFLSKQPPDLVVHHANRDQETNMPDVMQGNPKRVETIILNDEVETPSLLNPMSGQIFVTNRVGKRIMELSDGSHSVDYIAEEITRDFKGAKMAVVLEETRAFLRASTSKGLITWEQ